MKPSVPVRGERDLTGLRIGKVQVTGAVKTLVIGGGGRAVLWAGKHDSGRPVYGTARRLGAWANEEAR